MLTKNRPGASYRVHEGSVTLDGKDYRAAVVHSSAHDQRRQKRLERELRASRSEIEEVAKATAKKIFFCRPDAEAAEVRAFSRAYHRLNVCVIERPRYGRGRPGKNVPKIPVAIDYVLGTEVVEKHDAVAKRRQLAGGFVLLSNLPDKGEDEGGYGAERIVRTYKEQNAIERNVSFLKDDRIVNALFLKRPERIEALGLILLIALLIELVMRTELQAREATVPGWDDKPTARPTAYMVTWKFKGVLILCVGGQRLFAKPLTHTQKAFLQILQVPARCFTEHSRDG